MKRENIDRYPLKMKPAIKDYIWGGTRLKDDYGKETDLPVIAESWELSCHPDGQSTVQNGELANQTLGEVVALYPEWMGLNCKDLEGFPLLVKLIDAQSPLSLQVHPYDEYAYRVENQPGKNEMWYIVDAKPGAELILGFNEALPKDEIRAMILEDKLLPAVRHIPVSAGDCYRVPAGLLHAIGGDIFIIEVQQASNVTYRVYDYGRTDQNGNRRELHIDKALDVLDTTLEAQKSNGSILADWRYFKSELFFVNGDADFNCGDESFRCVIVIDDNLSLTWNGGELLLGKGETVLIPAGMGEYSLKGSTKIMLVSIT